MANITILSPISGLLLTSDSISHQIPDFFTPFHHLSPQIRQAANRICQLHILPYSGTLHSPFDGTLQEADTAHGHFFILSKSGIPLLLRLCHSNGSPLPTLPEALLTLVNSNTAVRAGQVLARADLAAWRRTGWEPHLQLLLSLPDSYRAFCQKRQCEGGKTLLLLLQGSRRRQGYSRHNAPYKNSP